MNNPPFIIFLDFDGVLCTLRQSYAEGDLGVLGCLDPVAIRFLDRITTTYNVKIVISSTWRLGNDVQYFYSLFKAAGAYNLANSLHEDFKTVSDCGFRGNDVEKWLVINNEVLDYLIIDDESDFHEYQKPKIVKTCGDNGILLDNYKDIINRLEVTYEKSFV